MSEKPLIVACIPAYNEERTIAKVIVKTMKHVDKVIVCDEAGAPRVKVEIVGYGGRVEVDAILDTGFNGELCVPIPVAIQLGLDLMGETLVTYADVRVEAELLFAGKAKVEEAESEVEITLTSGDETILGTSLLRGAEVLLGFRKESLRYCMLARRLPTPEGVG